MDAGAHNRPIGIAYNAPGIADVGYTQAVANVPCTRETGIH